MPVLAGAVGGGGGGGVVFVASARVRVGRRTSARRLLALGRLFVTTIVVVDAAIRDEIMVAGC